MNSNALKEIIKKEMLQINVVEKKWAIIKHILFIRT
jgi:hypothetical protein